MFFFVYDNMLIHFIKKGYFNFKMSILFYRRKLFLKYVSYPISLMISTFFNLINGEQIRTTEYAFP